MFHQAGKYDYVPQEMLKTKYVCILMGCWPISSHYSSTAVNQGPLQKKEGQKEWRKCASTCSHQQTKRDDSETDRGSSLTYIMNSSGPRILSLQDL